MLRAAEAATHHDCTGGENASGEQQTGLRGVERPSVLARLVAEQTGVGTASDVGARRHGVIRVVGVAGRLIGRGVILAVGRLFFRRSLLLRLFDHRHHEGERELGRVAFGVVGDQEVLTLDRSEHAGADEVDVRPLVVRQVLDHAVDRHVRDLVEVGQLDRQLLEPAVRRGGHVVLHGDRGSAVVDHEPSRGRRGVVARQIPGRDLDLVGAILCVQGGVDREVERVRVLDLVADELLPLAVDELHELDVRTVGVLLDLADREGVLTADDLAARKRQDRLRGVELDDDGGLVAQPVLEDEGVLTLDRAEHARLEAVEIRPHVVRDRLLDSVDPELRDVRLVVQLEADELVDAFAALGAIGRRRAGLDEARRTGGVEVQRVRLAGVAGDVVRDDGVGTLDCSELARLDAVEVGVDAVGEILHDTVDGDVGDLAGIEELEARDLGPAVDERRPRLERDRRVGVVDDERELAGRRDVPRGVERVVLHRVGAVGQTAEVDRQAPACTAHSHLVGVDERGTGVDVRDDLDETGLIGRTDHEGCAGAVEAAGRPREDACDGLGRVENRSGEGQCLGRAVLLDRSGLGGGRVVGVELLGGLLLGRFDRGLLDGVGGLGLLGGVGGLLAGDLLGTGVAGVGRLGRVGCHCGHRRNENEGGDESDSREAALRDGLGSHESGHGFLVCCVSGDVKVQSKKTIPYNTGVSSTNSLLIKALF